MKPLKWSGRDDNGVYEARADALHFRVRRVRSDGPDAWLLEVRDISTRVPRPFVWIEAPTRRHAIGAANDAHEAIWALWACVRDRRRSAQRGSWGEP